MTSTPPLTGLAPRDALGLDATHRCDRCGAQAYVRVGLLAGGELLFCGHHYTRHSEPLVGRTAWVVDARDRLAASTPGAAAAD